MITTKKIQSVRESVLAERKAGKVVGFVPTMGALHAGHISLIKAAREKCDFVVVSIFVNPTQFAPREDLESYPRPIEQDLEICAKNGVDVVFNPSVQEMYPSKNLTWVNVEKLTGNLCGISRPTHFRGVATVCSKLFNIVQPDFAFLGQKDAQQAAVIKKMVHDLNMPLQIIVCPIIREPDGLAISSRNKYLSETERKDAGLVYKSLEKALEMINEGVKESSKITAVMNDIMNKSSIIEIEYVSIVDSETLSPVEVIKEKVLIAVAVKTPSARLIDNILVDVRS